MFPHLWCKAAVTLACRCIGLDSSLSLKWRAPLRLHCLSTCCLNEQMIEGPWAPYFPVPSLSFLSFCAFKHRKWAGGFFGVILGLCDMRPQMSGFRIFPAPRNRAVAWWWLGERVCVERPPALGADVPDSPAATFPLSGFQCLGKALDRSSLKAWS